MKLQLYCDMDNAAAKRDLFARLATMHGSWRIELSRYRETRTSAQNRYYRGVVVASFYHFLREQDWDVNHPEYAHKLLANKFLKKDVVNPRSGEVIDTVTRSTTELDVAEMSDYIDRCITYLEAVFGIVVPSPDQWGVPK